MPSGDHHLSALDGAFLDLDTAAAPLHVGWTMRAEGRAPSLAALRRHLDGRLDRVPRFRCRVTGGRPGLPGGERRWQDDPGFDVARHVHAVALAEPGGPAELRATAGALLSTPLDPARPLWRMYLVTGVAGGGFALVGQAHHALVDGVAALEVAALLLDAEPSPAAPSGRPEWRPVAAEPAGAVAARRVRRAGARAQAAARAGAAALETAAAPPAAALSTLRAAGDALGALAQPPAATALDRTAGPARAVAFAEVGLDAVREAGRRRDATVNDVLLAASSVALGRALRRRGEAPQRLKAMVPVNVRGADDGAGGLGNRISFLFVDLPVAEPDPARALAIVGAQTRAAKDAGHAGPLDAVAQGAELLPATARRAVARAAARVGAPNVVVSNVAGPEAPLYLLGRPISAIFPAVPVLDGRALTIGALSYRGRVCVGLYADAEVVPDVVELARDLEGAVDALRLAPPAPAAGERVAAETPWRRRARSLRAARD